ncbi:MAG: transpeptidase family protein [Ignavibacteriaceae bacterium]|nr:transpeptidase family protein [Ignavibacteriaceae bacterium]
MINSRTLTIAILMLLFFTILIVKLIDIQVFKSEELKYFAQRQQTRWESITAERGRVYDRNNLLLEYNRHDVTYSVDLRMLKKSGKKKIAQKFSEIFGKDYSHYMNLMSGSKKMVVIEKKVNPETAALLKDFKVEGLKFDEDPSRVYQYGRLASHVLGYVDETKHGITGIEKSYDTELFGVCGTKLVERNALGQIIAVSQEENYPAISGSNLVLTINKTYQEILEQELKSGIDQYGGKSAMGIIMDPGNGEILALANSNDFDPNIYSEFALDDRRNRCISDTYEPGSTFKAFTLAALLEENLVSINDKCFVENGTFRFKNKIIKDTHPDGWLTVKQVFEKSSNIGFAKLVQKIDNDKYYKYLRGFGFGNFTSIDLPGEVKGKLKKPNLWSSLSKVYMSFGYEVAVTPIQLITAFSALINGGILYQPFILKKKVDDSGKLISENSPTAVRRVISEKTSQIMRDLLIGVVKNGTGVNAKLDDFNAGGKTGTSKKIIGTEYSDTEYNSSFIGFFPAENPQLVCLIIVDSPEKGKYGGLVAAPIFKEVGNRIIQSDLEFFQDNIKPNTKSDNISTENSDENNSKLNVKYVSNEFKLKERSEVDIKKNLMPDLKNLPLRDGLLILNYLNVKYKVNGSGRIVYQSIKPGERINKKSLCILNCEEIKVNGTQVY